MKALANLIAILTTLLSLTCYGQNGDSSKNQKVSDIEDFIENVNADDSLVEGISEGIIDYEGQSGGFETYYLYELGTKKLFRVRYNEATDTIVNFLIYYKDSEVIYAKAEKGYWKNGEYTELFKKTVYFNDGATLMELGSGLEPSDLLIIGEEYLKIHEEDFNYKINKN